MNIHQSRENRVIIELSAEDLALYGLSCTEITESGVQSKAVLEDLLRKAEEEIGKDLSESEKMMIDVLPEINGGCILLVSLHNTARPAPALICTLSLPEAVFSLAESLSAHQQKIVQSKLYLAENKDYIVLIRPTYAFEKALRRLLGEYGEVRRAVPLSCAYLKEHAVLLAEDFIGSLTA